MAVDTSDISDNHMAAIIDGLSAYQSTKLEKKELVIYCRPVGSGTQVIIFHKSKIDHFFSIASKDLGKPSLESWETIRKEALACEMQTGRALVWVDTPDGVSFLLINADEYTKETREALNTHKDLN